MISEYPYCYVARISLELLTPLSISAGNNSIVVDNFLVRDANGLATIPGTSLAGVLRHCYGRHFGKLDDKKIFGYVGENSSDGGFSRLQVSWGYCHDQNNRPVVGLLDEGQILNDEVLLDANSEESVKRHHVCIDDHRGVGIDKGKFERLSLKKGHRFSFEVLYWSDREKDNHWYELLQCMYSPYFRLGGKKRSGLGKVSIISLATREFCFHGGKNLQAEKDLLDFAKLRVDMSDKVLRDYNVENKDTKGCKGQVEGCEYILTLDAYDFLRIGGGESSGLFVHEADINPVLEKVIRFSKGKQATVSKDAFLLIPASSIKGALRHRTAFHFNCLKQRYIGIANNSQFNDAVDNLFGFSRDVVDMENKNLQGKKESMTGQLFFDDIYLPQEEVSKKLMQHVGIDRFTGAARDGVLFTEGLTYGLTGLKLKITWLKNHLLTHKDDHIKQAFELALEDLCQGRLAIGGGSAKGHGFFKGGSIMCRRIDNIFYSNRKPYKIDENTRYYKESTA